MASLHLAQLLKVTEHRKETIRIEYFRSSLRKGPLKNYNSNNWLITLVSVPGFEEGGCIFANLSETKRSYCVFEKIQVTSQRGAFTPNESP